MRATTPRGATGRRRRPAGRSRWTPEEDETLRHLVAARVGEKGAAEAMGRTTSSVRRRRRRLGLPPFGFSVAELSRRAERAKRCGACHRWAEGVAALAARYNLPAGLRVREVEILLALTDGPLDGDQLAARLGISRNAVTGRVGGSYTATLTARGLVTRIDAARGRKLYLLTPLALTLFADNPEARHGR